MNNHEYYFMLNVITEPFSYFNGGLTKPPLKLWNDWVNISRWFTWKCLSIHALNPMLAQLIYGGKTGNGQQSLFYRLWCLLANVSVLSQEPLCWWFHPTWVQMLSYFCYIETRISPRWQLWYCLTITLLDLGRGQYELSILSKKILVSLFFFS